STCEHHLLPFHGHAHVAYLPSQQSQVIGLSKLPRVVHMFAQRLQVQERITSQVAQFIMQAVNARGVAVLLEATHLCMSMRG
ncbi:core region of GTP cyclohydrolase I, partial [Tribonema minus]